MTLTKANSTHYCLDIITAKIVHFTSYANTGAPKKGMPGCQSWVRRLMAVLGLLLLLTANEAEVTNLRGMHIFMLGTQ